MKTEGHLVVAWVNGIILIFEDMLPAVTFLDVLAKGC